MTTIDRRIRGSGKMAGRTAAWAAAAGLALGSIGANAQMAPTDLSDLPGIVQTPDVVFATVGDRELMLDLYMPEGVDNPPLIVWVHPGGWRAGSRKIVNAIGLVNGGYAMASVSHRLSGVAPFPAQAHDIKAAIRFLRAHAAQYGYDASGIAISGSSSGAHLAALVGVTNGHPELEGDIGDHTDESSDVQAVVSYFGASNLTTILDQSTPFGLRIREPALEGLLGGPLDETEALARLASPVFHVDANDPPMLLLHGDQDPQMPINQTHELHGAAKEHGLDVSFEVVHGAAHGGEAFWDEQRTSTVLEFLRAHIGGGS